MFSNFRNVIYTICSALSIPTYDYWPTNVAFPYLVTYDAQSADDNAKNADAGECIFSIHIFDKYKGKATVIAYAESLKTGLYAATASDVHRTFSYIVMNDKEPDVAHAIVTIRLKY